MVEDKILRRMDTFDLLTHYTRKNLYDAIVKKVCYSALDIFISCLIAF
jgi:hypothetical protein